MNTLETRPEVASVAKTFAEYAAAPDSYSSIEGVPPEITVRLPGFADFGIDGEKLIGAVREAGPQMGPATSTPSASSRRSRRRDRTGRERRCSLTMVAVRFNRWGRAAECAA